MQGQQSVIINSISISGDQSAAGEIAYGEKGVVSINVEGYKGNKNSVYRDQDKVHIVLAQQDDEGRWVDLTACRVFGTKFQDCECDGDVEEVVIESFPQVRLSSPDAFLLGIFSNIVQKGLVAGLIFAIFCARHCQDMPARTQC